MPPIDNHQSTLSQVFLWPPHRRPPSNGFLQDGPRAGSRDHARTVYTAWPLKVGVSGILRRWRTCFVQSSDSVIYRRGLKYCTWLLQGCLSVCPFVWRACPDGGCTGLGGAADQRPTAQWSLLLLDLSHRHANGGRLALGLPGRGWP